MAKLLLAVLQLVLLAQLSKPCLIKPKLQSAKELKLDGPWNDASYKTNVGSCECGSKLSPGQIPPWNLFIHAGSNICSGSIITSNLVATSHDCVFAGRRQLKIYETWNISSKNKAYEISEINVTTSIDQKGGETFAVLELIPNPRFLLSWGFGSKSEELGYDSLDLLLIKLNVDFTSHKDLSPICIPEDATKLDFFERTGYYAPFSGGSPAGNISQEMVEGVIFTYQMCEGVEKNVDIYLASPKRAKNDELSGLCLRWFPANEVETRPQMPLRGALSLKTKEGNSFLAGVAYKRVTPPGTWVDYAQFSNIIPMIKYLEHRAHQHNSTWCNAPAFNLENKLPPINGHPWLWPWESESVQETLKVREETLDCVCGVPNNELSSRIVGGEDATPYEFGWMVAILIYFDGKMGKNTSFCGGSIINDRMILTAAHCLISEPNIPTGETIKPKDIDVFTKFHGQGGFERPERKAVEQVIVHPDYAPAVTRKYFDYDIVLKDKLVLPPVPQTPDEKSTPRLRPICLPKMGETIELIGKQAMVAGWGLTHPDDENSQASNLQKLELPIKPLQSCRSIASALITDRFICAGTHQKFKDAGRGDSGGPLSIMRERQWTEVGIVSWNQPRYQGSSTTATLYTNLISPDILPFLDFFAKRVGVDWCKSTIS